MKTYAFYLAIISCVAALAVASAQTNTPGKEEKPVEPPKIAMFTGIIEDLHAGARTLEVKAVLITKKFNVAPDCEVVVTDKPKAGLDDLKVGDEVNVTYQEQAGGLIAHRIEHKGVSPAEKEAAREKEHLEKLMTPNPSERRND
jgi:hypothetical protein